MKLVRITLLAALCGSVACEADATLDLAGAPPEPLAGSGDDGAIAWVPEPACIVVGDELCNGGDDDCNGAVDDGCTHTIAWTHARAPDALGSATGGVAFRQPCPTGSVLTGLRYAVNEWLNQVSAICQQLDVSSGDAGSLSIELGERYMTPTIPAIPLDIEGMEGELVCPAGTAITGFESEASGDLLYTYALRLSCAPLIISSASLVTLDASESETIDPLVCTGCSEAPSYTHASALPDGQISTGLFGGAGHRIDRIGFETSRATIERIE